MTINGNGLLLDPEGASPVIQNDRVLVPFRAIFEALSAEVFWDEQTATVTGKRGNTEIRLVIGSRTAYKNGMEIYLDAAPSIINGRTMAPLRFVAESLGADVSWAPGARTVTITQIERFIEIKDIRIRIGDTLEYVKSLLGDADRVDPSSYDFNWHVYNSDYSRFIMVGVKNGFVEALYTNANGFFTNGAMFGDVRTQSGSQVKLYFDSNDGGRLYACLIISNDVIPKGGAGSDFFRAQELEIFDFSNAFRANYGLDPLEPGDDAAALTALNHSRDMADRNYFSHNTPEGLSPMQLYKNNGGESAGTCENIAAGRLLSIDTFNDWVNSKEHRHNMLGPYNHLGVGAAYNQSSKYTYYMTQLFTI